MGSNTKGCLLNNMITSLRPFGLSKQSVYNCFCHCVLLLYLKATNTINTFETWEDVEQNHCIMSVFTLKEFIIKSCEWLSVSIRALKLKIKIVKQYLCNEEKKCFSLFSFEYGRERLRKCPVSVLENKYWTLLQHDAGKVVSVLPSSCGLEAQIGTATKKWF